MQLAKTDYRLGDAVRAESLLKEIVAGFPDYAEGRFELASFYAAQKRIDEAFALLDRDSVEFENQKGILYLMLSQPARAVSEFLKAVQAEPKSEFCNNLGIAYQQAGQLAEAEKAFRMALEIDPDHEQASANLAFLYIQQNRWAEAESNLLRVTVRNPKLWRARMALGFVYEKEGKVDQARRVYEAYLADAPPNAPDRAQVQARLHAL